MMFVLGRLIQIGNSGWSSIVSRETIAEFEFDAGALFISSTNLLVREIWQLTDINNPASASMVSSLPSLVL